MLLVSHDQLDARHLGAVTLAVSGLEDARVAAVPLRELRSDFLKELVADGALLDVPAGETARVQRAFLGSRDQLLDERAELFRLRLGRLDRPALDERGGETSH